MEEKQQVVHPKPIPDTPPSTTQTTQTHSDHADPHRPPNLKTTWLSAITSWLAPLLLEPDEVDVVQSPRARRRRQLLVVQHLGSTTPHSAPRIALKKKGKKKHKSVWDTRWFRTHPASSGSSMR